MDGIFTLPISFENKGAQESIYPILISDHGSLLLVDCGYPGFLPLLQRAIRKAGFDSRQVSAILVTHHDIDHIGALAEWKQAYPHCKILAPLEEVPYIEGKKRSLRLQQAEGLYDSLPEQDKAAARHFQQFLQSVQPVTVDQALLPGEILPYCGGLEIVPTPGHLPGHISLYAKNPKIMIAGDAIVADNGILDLANPAYAIDLKAAVASVEQLMRYEIDQLFCFHGGVFTYDIKKHMAQVVHRYSSQSA